MSLANGTENDCLKMLLKGVDPSYRSGATQYLALFDNNAGTPADLEAGGRTYELTYTGYARLPLTKASAWTDNGSSFVNAALVQFGKRTDGGATQTAKYFAVVDTASGAFALCFWGTLNAELPVSLNIQPQFDAGQLTLEAD
jgi:hypothetical protein